MTDIAYDVKTSTNLATWDPKNFEVIATVTNGEGSTLAVKIIPAIGDSAELFTRLLVNNRAPRVGID